METDLLFGRNEKGGCVKTLTQPFFMRKKVCRNARCTFFLVYHRYKSVYFLQAAIIRRFL